MRYTVYYIMRYLSLSAVSGIGHAHSGMAEKGINRIKAVVRESRFCAVWPTGYTEPGRGYQTPDVASAASVTIGTSLITDSKLRRRL